MGANANAQPDDYLKRTKLDVDGNMDADDLDILFVKEVQYSSYQKPTPNNCLLLGTVAEQ